MGDNKPTLYVGPLFGRSLHLWLKKMNALDKINLIELNTMRGETRTSEFIALNPFHTVPTLVSADKTLVLYESTAIFEYLNELFQFSGDFGFANDNIILKYKQINMLHKYHNLMAPAHLAVMGPFKLAIGVEHFDDVQGLQLALQQGLEYAKSNYYPLFETILKTNGGFLTGQRPSAVDIHYWFDLSLLIIDEKYGLGIYTFVHFPHLAKWLDEMKRLVLDVELYDTVVAPLIAFSHEKLKGACKLIQIE